MTSWGVLISDGADNIAGGAWLLIYPAMFARRHAVLRSTSSATACATRSTRRTADMAERNRSFDPRSRRPLRHRRRTRCRCAASTSTSATARPLAIVGESGSGKSQIMMAVDGPARHERPRDRLGRAIAARSCSGSRHASSTAIRGAKITMIFQEPMTSLDPLYRIGRPDRRAADPSSRPDTAAAHARALELLELVGIPSPSAAHRFLSA